MSIPSLELRRVYGNFATGVTIVTCQVGPRKHGITVNSYKSVSLDSALVLNCIDGAAISWGMSLDAGVFAVIILSEVQRAVCAYFAKRLFADPEDEFAGIPHLSGVT